MRQTLESYLSKVTMYTLVALGLAGILSVAFLLASTGNLSIEPVQLVLSSLLFGVTCFVSNEIIGRLYGVRPHYQSALITALILTCIFTPPSDVTEALKLVLVAVVSQASKYILVYNQRHIINPAAAGALILGLTTLVYPSWWIATASLIPITALGAFLVLYKTRQLRFGLILVVLSVLIVSLRTVADASLSSALLDSLIVWPIIFLAGFMFSEPLTLPSKSSHKVAVAATVAIIFSIPFNVGSFHSSPELALVAGNLLAFAFAYKYRRSLKLELVGRKQITPSVQEIQLATKTPVQYEPGQYLELTIPHKADSRGLRRMFSITAAPGSQQISLGIKFSHPSSSFKKALKDIKNGAFISSTGVAGDFTIPKDASQKLLFVAGGIGITPFISHIRSIQAKDEDRDISLLYFVSKPEETAYKEEIKQSSIRTTFFSSDKTTNPEYVSKQAISAALVAQYIPDINERIVYISGPPGMVESARKAIKPLSKGVKTDHFNGY